MAGMCYGCMKEKKESPICEHCGFDDRVQNNTNQLPLGTEVGGQYILGRVLGQGGFGITYLAWDQVLEMPVALKEYFPSGYAGRDARNTNMVTSYDRRQEDVFEENKKRFLREAESLAKLWDIPQIVKILRYFEENGTAYIAMEYVQGKDLRNYMKDLGRPMTPEEVLQILLPVTDALGHVHGVDLVHRDVSPDNIMVLPDGSVKLLDFGAARYVENAVATQDRNTSTQAILKHGFAPPEQYRTRGALGPWSDVYALCATMYYCMTGKVPPEAMSRTLGDERIDFGTIPGLTSRQKRALQKGMSLQPKDRFSSMAQLRQQLEVKKPENHKKTGKKTLRLIPAAVLAAVCLAAGLTRAALQPTVQNQPEIQVQPTAQIQPLDQVQPTEENSADILWLTQPVPGGVAIVGFNGEMKSEVVIPAQIGGKSVVAVGEKAFSWCIELEKITLPESIAAIDAYAFEKCFNLHSVQLPQNLEHLGEGAFYGCQKLNGISIPDGITEIPDSAFQGCTGLRSIQLPKNLQVIGNAAFRSTGLTTFVVPDSVHTMGDYVFYDSDLKDMLIRGNVKQVGAYAFYGCAALKNLVLGEGITHIGDYAFWGCESLPELNLPNSLQSIGSYAFSICWGLKEVEIPAGVQKIGDFAFQNHGLETIRIPRRCELGRGVLDGPRLVQTEIIWY